jgi:hypothetical protein|tara:strand:- start:4328 stop:4570 length:243 start_codon:yes stop_codon:yes gene_type:complete
MTENDNDNIVHFPRKIELKKDPVPVLCEIAGKTLTDVLILGSTEDGTIKMITTQEDVADILFYLEAAKFSIMESGLSEPE